MQAAQKVNKQGYYNRVPLSLSGLKIHKEGTNARTESLRSLTEMGCRIPRHAFGFC